MPCDVEDVRTELPGAATSPRLARRFVDDALAAWSLEPLRDSVELLTCELVTNAVLHVRGTLVLRLQRLDAGIRVEVTDASATAPHRAHVVDDEVESTTGRGLVLVEALAAAWGVEATGDGKTVWFEVLT